MMSRKKITTANLCQKKSEENKELVNLAFIVKENQKKDFTEFR